MYWDNETFSQLAVCCLHWYIDALLIDWLIELRFYILLETKQLISEALFLANLLTNSEESKGGLH